MVLYCICPHYTQVDLVWGIPIIWDLLYRGTFLGSCPLPFTTLLSGLFLIELIDADKWTLYRVFIIIWGPSIVGPSPVHVSIPSHNCIGQTFRCLSLRVEAVGIRGLGYMWVEPFTIHRLFLIYTSVFEEREGFRRPSCVDMI